MGKCAGKPCGINEIGPELVFRGAQEKCTHNPNQISAFASELVFRQVPGKFVQRRGYTERFGRARRLRRVALIDSIGGGVASVSATPTGLCLLAPGRLALGLSAGSLAVADSRVRSEPRRQIRQGFFRASGIPLHRPPSRWLTSAEHGWVVSRECRRFVQESNITAELMAKYAKMSGEEKATRIFSESRFQTNLFYIQRQFESALGQFSALFNSVRGVSGMYQGAGERGLGGQQRLLPQYPRWRRCLRTVLLVRPDIFASLGLQNQNTKVRDNSVFLDWRTNPMGGPADDRVHHQLNHSS